jgi:hypothetical protein
MLSTSLLAMLSELGPIPFVCDWNSSVEIITLARVPAKPAIGDAISHPQPVIECRNRFPLVLPRLVGVVDILT